ncbi:hypothetical protein Tco_0555991 [Tanacetum coccineum]
MKTSPTVILILNDGDDSFITAIIAGFQMLEQQVNEGVLNATQANILDLQAQINGQQPSGGDVEDEDNPNSDVKD